MEMSEKQKDSRREFVKRFTHLLIEQTDKSFPEELIEKKVNELENTLFVSSGKSTSNPHYLLRVKTIFEVLSGNSLLCYQFVSDVVSDPFLYIPPSEIEIPQITSSESHKIWKGTIVFPENKQKRLVRGVNKWDFKPVT